MFREGAWECVRCCLNREHQSGVWPRRGPARDSLTDRGSGVGLRNSRRSQSAPGFYPDPPRPVPSSPDSRGLELRPLREPWKGAKGERAAPTPVEIGEEALSQVLREEGRQALRLQGVRLGGDCVGGAGRVAEREGSPDAVGPGAWEAPGVRCGGPSSANREGASGLAADPAPSCSFSSALRVQLHSLNSHIQFSSSHNPGWLLLTASPPSSACSPGFLASALFPVPVMPYS